MAQTVKVEIPIEATDNTGKGVSSAERRLTSLERSMAKMEKQLARLDKKHDVNIDANDRASEKIDSVSGDADKLDGQSANVDVEANDRATDIINGALSSVDELDGSDAEADLEANDMATDVIEGARDSVDEFDSAEGTAEIDADDMATDVIHGASNEVENFGGMEANATIGANDEASAVIDSVSGKAHEWANSAFVATIGVLGATVGVADTINTYKDFQSTMSEVEAISGATKDQMHDLTEEAKSYGSTTKFTATQAGEAFKYMAMAGWEVSDMQAGIGGILNLAAAAGEDLGTTSDIVTDALTAFGYGADQATRFSDVLAAASSNSNTNVSMMGETFKYVGTMAGTLGYEIEDVAVAAGAMANAGIKSSMSGTALNTILTRLSTNTNGARDAIEDLGVSFFKEDGSARPLIDVMEDLRTATADMTTEQQTAFAKVVAGTTAQKGLNAILNASEKDWEKLTGAIYNADGAAGRMADTMMDNLSGSITLFQSALEGVKDTLGERTEPYLRSAIDGLTEMLPGASEQINRFMNNFDRTIEKMKLSKEWKDGSFLDKVNIAWDTIIGKPFSNWVSGKGKKTFSEGIANLFSEAMNILPGGEQAGLTSWLSAGLIGIGASKIIGGVSSLSGMISGLSSFGGTVGMIGSTIGGAVPYIAAATAALAALGIAIDAFNTKQINASFAEHFGEIELTAEQIEQFAGKIVNAEFTANIDLALGELNGADKVHDDAEERLRENDSLEWKCSVGLKLSEDEQQTYLDNVDQFIKDKKKEIENQFSGVTLAIKTVIDEDNSIKMIDTVSEWFAEDEEKLNSLSAQLTAAVESALEDGIIDVNEQGAINALQDKINSILSSWNESKSQTQLDMIQQKYGHLTGADLTEETFAEIISSYQSQREYQEAELEALSEQYYDFVNSAKGSGRLTDDQATEWKNRWMQGVWSKQGSSLANALSFEGNTLKDTYGSEISQNIADSNSWVMRGIENQINPEIAKGAGNIDLSALQNYLQSGVINQTGNASGALKSLYKQMEPDVNAMGELIDKYRKEFETVPQNLLDSYNEAVEIGAAAGNESAAWQVYANNLLKNGSSEVVDALTNPNNELYESIRNASPELAKAVDRAISEGGENIEIDDLMAEIKGIEFDESKVQELLTDAEKKVQEDIESAGGKITAVTDADLEVKIESGDTLSEIAEAVGMTVDEIAEYNNISDPNVIMAGATLKIPRDKITVDEESGAQAIQESIQTFLDTVDASGSSAQVTAEGIEVSLGQVEVDGQSAAEQIAEAIGITVEELASYNGYTVQEIEAGGVTVRIPTEGITVNSEGLSEAISQKTEEAANEAGSGESTIDRTTKVNQIMEDGEITDNRTNVEPEESEPVPQDVPVNVTYTNGSSNLSEFSEAIKEEVKTALESIPVSPNVDVTLTKASDNIPDVYSKTNTDLVTAFATNFPANGNVDVTLSRASDNIAAIYSGVQTDIQSTFDAGFSASAPVSVHLNYSISNPSASISLGGNASGSGTVTASIASNATGNKISGKILSWLGEEGPEYVIPTTGRYKQRGQELWMAAGEDLGMFDNVSQNADGAYVDEDQEIHNPFASSDQNIWTTAGSPQESMDTSSGESKPVSVVTSGGEKNSGNVEVKVELNPTIQIDGNDMDEDKIFEIIKSRIRELGDDIADEIATQMAKAFDNMPLGQGA